MPTDHDPHTQLSPLSSAKEVIPTSFPPLKLNSNHNNDRRRVRSILQAALFRSLLFYSKMVLLRVSFKNSFAQELFH